MMHKYDWYKPECIYLAAGAATGGTPLNAFDNALMNAGITEFNLIEVSSIAPPTTPVKKLHIDGVIPAKGLLAPTIYEKIESDNQGEEIAAAAGVGIPQNEEEPGIIFPHTCRGTSEEAKKGVRKKISEGVRTHGVGEASIKTIADSFIVESPHSAVISAVLFADTELNKVIESELAND